MGSGRWSDDTYHHTKRQRAASGIDDFQYSSTSDKNTTVHPSLDPMRINKKPFKKLESRDSAEHQESNAVFVCFDVTGSNIERAKDAQQKLPNLFGMLGNYLTDPQLLFAANDDILVEDRRSIQIGEFESDNRCDEQLRNILLTSNGGGNDGESYDLILYAAAFKTVIDCFEKRKRKGYFFMYADEPIRTHVHAEHAHRIFGDNVKGKLPITAVIEELKKRYHTYVIWPLGGYDHAHAQYKALFGKENVLVLQHPNMICELIGSTIGVTEKVVSRSEAARDLIARGVDQDTAKQLTESIATHA